MANRVTVRIEGLRGVMGVLRGLPKELKAGRIVRRAVRKGGVVIQEGVKANIRRVVAEPNVGGLPTESSGALEASVTVRRKSPEGGKNGEAVSVGVSKLTKRALATLQGVLGDPRYYIWWLEFGTERMRPHPVVRPAFDTKKEVALATMVTELNRGIASAFRKLKQRFKVRT